MKLQCTTLHIRSTTHQLAARLHLSAAWLLNARMVGQGGADSRSFNLHSQHERHDVTKQHRKGKGMFLDQSKMVAE